MLQFFIVSVTARGKEADPVLLMDPLVKLSEIKHWCVFACCSNVVTCTKAAMTQIEKQLKEIYLGHVSAHLLARRKMSHNV